MEISINWILKERGNQNQGQKPCRCTCFILKEVSSFDPQEQSRKRSSFNFWGVYGSEFVDDRSLWPEIWTLWQCVFSNNSFGGATAGHKNGGIDTHIVFACFRPLWYFHVPENKNRTCIFLNPLTTFRKIFFRKIVYINICMYGRHLGMPWIKSGSRGVGVSRTRA